MFKPVYVITPAVTKALMEVANGFLDIQNESRKGRSYRLGPAYERLIAPTA